MKKGRDNDERKGWWIKEGIMKKGRDSEERKGYWRKEGIMRKGRDSENNEIMKNGNIEERK